MTSRRPVTASALVASLVAVMAAPDVAAHGDPPEGQQIHAVDGGWVYNTNFGVVEDQRRHEYVCEEAFGAGTDYHVAPMGPSRWVLLHDSGVHVTDDGCDFERIDSEPDLPVDVAYREDTDEVVAVQRGDTTTIRYSDDGGRDWSVLETDLDERIPSGIGFLEGDRLVFVGYEAADQKRGDAVVAEIDIETGDHDDIELDEPLAYPELLDVRDDQVLWFASRDDDPVLFWSRDRDYLAGRTSLDGWPRSGAIDPEGDEVFFGRPGAVWRVERDGEDQPEEVVSGPRAQCMTATEQGELLICSHRDDDGHDLVRTDGDGGVEPLVDFRDLQGYRQDCDEGSDTNRTCPAVWEELATALDIETGSDEETDETDSGCAAVGATPSWMFALLVVLLVVGRGCRRGVPSGCEGLVLKKVVNPE